MLPFLGQGAAQAIEDGCVLGRCFGATSDDLDALRRYEKERRPRANRILLESREQGKRFQSQNPDGYDREKHKSAEPAELFGYNPATVPV
jgi:salicylate hydroxylase